MEKYFSTTAAAAKSLQSCPTLCDPIDGSPPGPTIPGILQARTLEWAAISIFCAWKWKAKVKSFSHVRLFITPWTAAYQAPPFMGFSRQEYWSGVPLPSPHMEDWHTFLKFKIKNWIKIVNWFAERRKGIYFCWVLDWILEIFTVVRTLPPTSCGRLGMSFYLNSQVLYL